MEKFQVMAIGGFKIKDKISIEKLISKDFSGAISVKKADDVVFQKAYGYSDLANKIKNQIDTKFPTASAGKVFVSVGILQLMEKAKLNLDDNIGNLLDFDLKKIDRNITVKQLLTHTSGIPDYFDESVMDEYAQLWKDYPNYKIRKSSDIIPLFIDKTMMYKPGEKFKYNNTGFVVLGLIIEKITKMPFDEYLTKNIFKPCKMFNTGYFELDRLPAKCANAYIYDSLRKEHYTNIFSVDAKGTGAGGAFTTVLDIDRFWENLLNGKLISKDILEQMLSVNSGDDEEGEYYGYGIWLDEDDEGVITPYFQGCDPGVSFLSSYNRQEKLGISIVSNFCDDVWELAEEILDII